MKILVTADLHYDIARSRDPTRDLARRVCAEGGDALVLVGDTAGARLEPLGEVLELFGDFPHRKLLVPGNHCLWSRPGENSLDRYEKILPEFIRRYGFEMLDCAPVVLNDVGLAGSIGWYDYSFADEALGIPEAFYEAKISPGAAVELGGYAELLDAHRDRLTERNLAIRSRWMDGVNVRVGMSDKAFNELLCGRLAEQLEALSAKVGRIIAFVHHLPFAQLVPRDRPDRFAFAAAFLGSPRLGEVLLNCPKVTHVYCGHSHWTSELKIEHITAVSVGSTYTEKHLEILDA